MANHKSSIKRLRSNSAKRLLNRYQEKTVRSSIKAFEANTDKTKATAELAKMLSMLDKLAKKNIIHKNNASNLKSKLTKRVNALK